MSIILALSAQNGNLWAAGPQGLYSVRDQQLIEVIQPQQSLACCLICDNHLLVGGSPHGVAYSLDQGRSWQAAWMDGVTAKVVAMAADPHAAETGVVLAATDGEGILRSQDRGESWGVCNFGLHGFTALTLAWAPPATAWPAWEVAFAGTDEGCYRSPNGGRGWKRCEGIDGIVQALAIAPEYHTNGVVLAGAEDTGVWRSIDGGHNFDHVPGAPESINALANWGGQWWASDAAGLWNSPDGVLWSFIEDASPVLVMLPYGERLLAGTLEGVKELA